MGRVLVLGAGFGGLTVATELARAGRHEVALVDARDSFTMGLAALGVLAGTRGADEGRRALRDVASRGVRFVQGEVERLDPQRRAARVGGRDLDADALVVALGARTESGVPGLAEHGHDVYTLAGAAAFRRDLLAMPRGDALLVVARMPFKCPPAPYEAAMLAKAVLAGKDARVTLASPEPFPMPIGGPALGAQVRALVESRGVVVRNGAQAVAVEKGLVRFADGAEARFDALGYVPAHRPPSVLVEAGLAAPDGFVPVDARTCATRHEGVHALGDCAALKVANGKLLPKAGILAEGQAMAVARNVDAVLSGRAPDAAFDGRGHCFLELGDGTAMKAEGDFYAQPDPVIRPQPPSRDALAEKKAFERERLARWFG